MLSRWMNRSVCGRLVRSQQVDTKKAIRSFSAMKKDVNDEALRGIHFEQDEEV